MVYRKVYILISVSLNSIVSLIVSLGQLPPSRQSFPLSVRSTSLFPLASELILGFPLLLRGCSPAASRPSSLFPGLHCCSLAAPGCPAMSVPGCSWDCARSGTVSVFASVFANFHEAERQPAVETKNATASLVAPCNAPTDTNSNQALHT